MLPGSVLTAAFAAYGRGDLAQARILFDDALRASPQDFDATQMLGLIRLQTGETGGGVTWLEKAVRIRPKDAKALANLGGAYMLAQRPRDALAAYDRALRIDPKFCGAISNRGTILQTLKRYEEAATAFQELRSLAPSFEYATGNLFQARRFTSDWRDFDELRGEVVAAVHAGQHVDRPFSFLSVSDSVEAQLQCARLHSGRLGLPTTKSVWNGPRYRHERLRVAYVSADFRDHVVLNLMTAIFEHHDRRRFEILGVALQSGDGSSALRRAKGLLDAFVDVSHLSDRAAANLLREREIDIAVDLTGYTLGCRPGIFALRAAPVQVNFLGYPATMGSLAHDYLIADSFVVPEAAERHYAEKIVRLPDSFQANGQRSCLLTDLPTPSRREAGLPPDGPVLCCFNHGYKFSPGVFAIWMRALRAAPNAVLWLLAESKVSEQRLRQSALAHGVAEDRLVFAKRIPYATHLARMRLADLFLDTWPFNAGATAGDALWAGVPILTLAGEAFASRMAGSLLRAVGLGELIAGTPVDYEERALRYVQDPATLADLKMRLITNRLTYPLFDTARYCRYLESAYLKMQTIQASGAAPASFSIAPER